MDVEVKAERRHLFIAGTGRAGTSFLVRYLAALGLDTHLGRHGENASWYNDANAGLEDAPLITPDTNLPYVIKSPWLYEFIDQLLADEALVPDAVIIPVRDLVEAATSRCVTEQRAIHEAAPWMSRFDRSWEDWAQVPGGIIYSLNPVDQGRLLAVGFHHLVQRLVAAGIPIIFLAFPRLTEDPAYLFEKLRPVLPPAVDHDMACAAHRSVADPAMVRVGSESSSIASSTKPHAGKIIGYEPPAGIDVIALRRELVRVRAQLADALCNATTANEQNHLAANEIHQQIETIAALKAELVDAAAATRQAQHDKDAVQAAFHQQTAQLQNVTHELSGLQQEALATFREKADLETELAKIRASRSWRLTRPYRAVGFGLLNVFHRVARRS